MDTLKSTDLGHIISEKVKEPNENDVLFGRGPRITNFQGNIRFRKLVKDHLPNYLCSNERGVKAELAKSIIATIKERQGRFLRKVATNCRQCSQKCSCYWVPVEDTDLIMEKIKQTFRDTAGTVRCNNKSLSKDEASRDVRFKSAIQKAPNNEAATVIPSKLGIPNAIESSGMDGATSSASEGNPNPNGRLVDDKTITKIQTASLQVDSKGAAETRVVVHPFQQDYNRGETSTLSGLVPLAQQLEEARARVNQERQILLRNNIAIRIALLKNYRQRRTLLIPSLQTQIMPQCFRFDPSRVGLQLDPHVSPTVHDSLVNNPSMQLSNLTALINQAYSRQSFSNPDT